MHKQPKCSKLLIIRRARIKTTRLHLTVIKKTKWQMQTWVWRSREPRALLGEGGSKSGMFGVELPRGLEIPFLDIYPKELKTGL
jgi:hypothetical protein